MTKRKRKQTRRLYHRSHYRLEEVIQKINSGQVKFRGNALRDAYKLFGWKVSDIKIAYRKLKPKHFHNTNPSINVPGVIIDAYKATIKGEKIYTHFYIDIDSRFLIVDSFHEQ